MVVGPVASRHRRGRRTDAVERSLFQAEVGVQVGLGGLGGFVASCRSSRPSRNIHRSNARNAVAATISEPGEQLPERHAKNPFTSRTVNPASEG